MVDDRIIEGSGNVFADIGVANPDEQLLKAGLVMKLADVMHARGLNQTAAAKLTGISQPDLSRILHGRFRDVSAERLLRALTRLDTDVEITVRSHGKAVGEPIQLHAVA